MPAHMEGESGRNDESLPAGHRSFRVSLVLAFVGLIVVSVLIIGVQTYLANRQVVLDVSRSLVSRTADTVVAETHRYLTPAIQATEFLRVRFAGRQGMLDDRLETHTDLLGVMRTLLRASPDLAMLYVGDRQGRFLCVIRLPDGRLATRFIFRHGDGRKERWYYPVGSPVPEIHTREFPADYDPRDRPWYQGAQRNRGRFWTDLYLFASTRTPGVTVSTPVLDDQREIGSVIGADIAIHTLSEFLQTVTIGRRGFAFIVNSKVELVAYPNPQRLIPELMDSFQPVRVSDLDEPWVVPAVAVYRQNTRTSAWRFMAGDEDYLVQLKDLPPETGSDWTVVVLAPERDFISGIKASQRTSLVITLVILLGATVIGLHLARGISRPIEHLAREMRRVEQFDLESPVVIRSRISEIHQMVAAFTSMRHGLGAFSRYVPVHLVRQLLARHIEPKPGGKPCCMTLLFTDIQGFTALSHTVDPATLMIDLSEYFDWLSRIISRHHGVVDKYMGDGLLAFWNAPEGDAEHADHACQAALECQAAVDQLNARRTAAGKYPLVTRIGIHTDDVVVGNVGGSDRLNYTVIGSGVNLASRLEGANKELNTRILISEATRQHLSEARRATLVDQGEIALRGAAGPIRVYSLAAADIPVKRV